MHPEVGRAFDHILRRRFTGGAVLEIGARPSDDTLLLLPALRGARERLGLDLDGPHVYRGVSIERGDANRMPYGDGRFDAVVCNSVLEHDPRFWLTLAEIRRVARPGGLVVLGVPGYADAPPRRALRLLRRLTWLPAVGRSIESALAATPTLLVHNFPADYYRFSEAAMREVLLASLREVEVLRLLSPPRLLGVGLVP